MARWVLEVSRRQNIKNPEYLNKENEAITKHPMQTQEDEIRGVRIAHPMRELTPVFHKSLEYKRRHLMSKIFNKDITKSKEQRIKTGKWDEVMEISSESSADSTKVVIGGAPNSKLRVLVKSRMKTGVSATANTEMKFINKSNVANCAREALPTEVRKAADELRRKSEKKWKIHS